MKAHYLETRLKAAAPMTQRQRQKTKHKDKDEVESSGPLDTTKAAPLIPPANGGGLWKMRTLLVLVCELQSCQKTQRKRQKQKTKRKRERQSNNKKKHQAEAFDASFRLQGPELA